MSDSVFAVRDRNSKERRRDIWIIRKDLLKVLTWKIHVLCSSAQDDSPVSLAIAKASNKDQGIYYCCLSNMYGKVTAEFNLTSKGKS